MTPHSEVLPAIRQQNEVTVKDFLPLMTVSDAVQRKTQINQFIGQVLVEETDYGKIPGTGNQPKKTLLKPGAEKLCSIFGLAPRYVKEIVVEDWTGENHGGEPLFSYEYRCQLYRGERFMGESIGSANTWETKHRYRWVAEDVAKLRTDFDLLPKRGGAKTLAEPAFAVEKKETGGQYGKPAEYWQQWEEAIREKRAKLVVGKTKAGKPMDKWEMTINQTLYRVPNPDVADCINTCQKMAQKRALVAAVLVVTNCSDAFTQDLDDFVPEESAVPFIDDGPAPQADLQRHAVQQPTNIPAELKPIFAGMRKDAKLINAAYTLMQEQLSALDGGLAYYDKVADAMAAKYPQGAGVEVHEKCILDLWEGLQSFKAALKEPEVVR